VNASNSLAGLSHSFSFGIYFSSLYSRGIDSSLTKVSYSTIDCEQLFYPFTSLVAVFRVLCNDHTF
jgi:hypothetical protein